MSPMKHQKPKPIQWGAPGDDAVEAVADQAKLYVLYLLSYNERRPSCGEGEPAVDSYMKQCIVISRYSSLAAEEGPRYKCHTGTGKSLIVNPLNSVPLMIVH